MLEIRKYNYVIVSLKEKKLGLSNLWTITRITISGLRKI